MLCPAGKLSGFPVEMFKDKRGVHCNRPLPESKRTEHRLSQERAPALGQAVAGRMTVMQVLADL